MFGLFKSKSPIEKLQKQYEKLHAESFSLSKTDRKAADLKFAEAEEIGKQIEALKSNKQ